MIWIQGSTLHWCLGSGGVGCGNEDSTLQFKERLKRFESFQGKTKNEASKNERGRENSQVAENCLGNTESPSLSKNPSSLILNFERKREP